MPDGKEEKTEREVRLVRERLENQEDRIDYGEPDPWEPERQES